MLEQLVVVWVNKLMEPEHAAWSETYPATAHEIATVSEAQPLFPGEDGPKRTALVLTAIYYHESRFNPQAVGDHGHSIGLGQINDGNFGWLGVTKEDLLQNTKLQVEVTLRLVKISFQRCAGKPFDEKLGWYASGGVRCGRTGNSKIKMGLVRRLEKIAAD